MRPFPSLTIGNPKDRRMSNAPEWCYGEPRTISFSYTAAQMAFVSFERAMAAQLARVSPAVLPDMSLRTDDTYLVGPVDISPADLPAHIHVTHDMYGALATAMDSRAQSKFVRVTLAGSLEPPDGAPAVVVEYSEQIFLGDHKVANRASIDAKLCVLPRSDRDYVVYLIDLMQS